MPFYRNLKPRESDSHEERVRKARTLDRLLRLRSALGEEVPDRTLKETLLLATWNIKDFDRPNYGPRQQEAIHYIAEIIARFDLVAVQEVYQDLGGLERLMDALGGYWDYIVTDTTAGDRGNDERMAFLYDTRKVRFGGLAGEVVLPPQEEEGGMRPVTQFWRTPFSVGFKSGWTDFILTTVHILWGSSRSDPDERVREIREVAQFMRRRAEDETSWSQNTILLGDFNIFGTDDETFQQLVEAGFEVPDPLLEFRSNASKTRHYDQIAFYPRPGSLDFTGRAGVFDFFDVVYREEDEALYVDAMGEAYTTTSRGEPRQTPSRYYQTYWRTQQMSDHLPMWVELKIDYSDAYLTRQLNDCNLPEEEYLPEDLQ
jgi:endonuclease/exonuclease/phosphatase family metal-dependent hydrolase